MAKKVQKPEVTHNDCVFKFEVDNEFLNYKGEPILGFCIWSKHRFLLNEKTDCEKFCLKNGNEDDCLHVNDEPNLSYLVV